MKTVPTFQKAVAILSIWLLTLTSLSATSLYLGEPVSGNEPERVLTAEEEQLLADLEAELKIDIAQIEALLRAGLESPTILELVVYDLNGNLIYRGEPKHQDQIPAGASHLMDDGTTRYYIVTSR